MPAYSTLEYRYPDTPFAEQAAVQKVKCLREMVRAAPNNLQLRENARLTVNQFKELYPSAEQAAEVNAFGMALVNSSAQSTFEIAEFYEKVPDSDKRASAKLYYQKVVDQYAGTDYADRAAKRIVVLSATGVKGLSDGITRVDAPLSEADEISAVSSNGVPAVESVPLKMVTLEDATNSVPLPERLVDDPNAIELTADRMEYIDGVLVADGNVVFQQEGAHLRAKHLTINQETGGLIATGDVNMLHENSIWQGERLVYNFKTREGNFGASAMYFEPTYISAESMTRVSEDVFMMTNAIITTCAGDKPIIYVKAKQVRVVDTKTEKGRLLEAKRVTFYIGKVPVFYMPVWRRHLGYRVFSYVLGYGGRVGAFFKTRAELHPASWLISNTHFDLYFSRGVGIGQDFTWKTYGKDLVAFTNMTASGETTNTYEFISHTNGTGYIKSYYINDSSPYESTESVFEEELVDSSRYRIRMGYDYDFTEETYLATRLEYVSDPYLLEDFFREEFRRNANPENYVVLQHSADQYASSLRIDKRLNEFYTTVDRLPELDFDWYRSQIKESKYYYEGQNSLAFLEKLNGSLDRIPSNQDSSVTNDVDNVSTNDSLLPGLPDYSSARFDTYHQIYLPLRLNEYYNVIPRVGYRGTWYSDSKGGGSVRNSLEFGTLASVKTYKTLSEKSGFYGDGLRHIIEPYADYTYRVNSGLDVNEIFQFDDIDQVDDENSIAFGVRNFLQSKRGENRIANVLDADLQTSYRLDPKETQDDFGPLEGDIEIHLTDKFNIYSDFEYDWYDTAFNDFNARADYTAEDMSYYSLSYRYDRDGRSLYTPHVRLFPNNKWSYEFYAQYDSSYGEWEERRFIINRKFDCVTVGGGLRVDEDNEALFWFQFWLNAFPSVGMGDQ